MHTKTILLYSVLLVAAVAVFEWRARAIVASQQQREVNQLRAVLDPIYTDFDVAYPQEPDTVADVIKPLVTEVMPLLSLQGFLREEASNDQIMAK
jgi:hypothetical protein